MDIDTQRVWDYLGDAYVHRLIDHKPGGKFVDLPSAMGGLNVDHDPDEHLRTDLGSHKLDDIGMEYTHLLTSQLESQRLYFEEKVAQAADKASRASRDVERLAEMMTRSNEELARLQTKHRSLQEDVLPALERDKARAERRGEKAAELARRMEKQWKEEKVINESLLARVTHLSQELERLKGANADLKEQNRDLTFYISGQAKLSELGEEVQEGTVTVGEASTGANHKKNKGHGRRGR